jgi:hypothetical protein
MNNVNNEPEIYIVSGSTSPFGNKPETSTSSIDGYEVYIIMPNRDKFKLSNKELEPFKISYEG